MTRLIIEDSRVQAMIEHLAEQRGISATDVVRDAVEQQLTPEEQRKIDRMTAIKELQARAAKTKHLWLTDNDIYDENGLPK
jgi:rv0623-like transcription factor